MEINIGHNSHWGYSCVQSCFDTRRYIAMGITLSICPSHIWALYSFADTPMAGFTSNSDGELTAGLPKADYFSSMPFWIPTCFCLLNYSREFVDELHIWLTLNFVALNIGY